jgi:tRNA threonylcarbamoyladenosine biosynthesis protein TsaB
MTGADTAASPAFLAFDAAGSACSVAVGIGDRLLGEERRAMRHGHAEALLPMIDLAMRQARIAPGALAIVATTVGPGGFTGIRTALAAAHGIALATGARLIGVTGFEAVVAAIPPDRLECGDTERALLVALDSRRADLYLQGFGDDRGALGAPQAVLPEAVAPFVADLCGDKPVLVAGDAAERAAALLADRTGTTTLADSAPEARGVAAAALRHWRSGALPGAVRPLYLRAPDVTMPNRDRAARAAR